MMNRSKKKFVENREKYVEEKNIDSCYSLEDLRDFASTNVNCSLKTQNTNFVFSSGPKTSPIMIIGEAPGEEENQLCKPFVGASGKLLDKTLGEFGIDRNKVYVSNVVFWRPPNNRPPNEEELEKCMPVVFKHIELKKPKILFLLGAVASKAVLKTSEGILKMRGKIFNLKDIIVIPTFHPSYLLRSSIHKDLWKSDFEVLKNKCIDLDIFQEIS